MTKVVLEFPISSCLLAVVSDMLKTVYKIVLMFRNMTRECAKVSGSDTPGMAAHAGNITARRNIPIVVYFLPAKRLHRRGQGKDTHTKRRSESSVHPTIHTEILLVDHDLRHPAASPSVATRHTASRRDLEISASPRAHPPTAAPSSSKEKVRIAREA